MAPRAAITIQFAKPGSVRLRGCLVVALLVECPLATRPVRPMRARITPVSKAPAKPACEPWPNAGRGIIGPAIAHSALLTRRRSDGHSDPTIGRCRSYRCWIDIPPDEYRPGPSILPVI
jgi:hypothetical protein